MGYEDDDYHVFVEAKPIAKTKSNSKPDTNTNIGKAPIPGNYTSLYGELCAKCDPANFMDPYDAEKVEISNEIYHQVLELEADEEELIALRNRAIQQLGIRIATQKLYEELIDYCNPKNFTGKRYDSELLSIANKVFPQILENADNIVALERIADSTVRLREIIRPIRKQEEERKRQEYMEVNIDILLAVIAIIIIMVFSAIAIKNKI